MRRLMNLKWHVVSGPRTMSVFATLRATVGLVALAGVFVVAPAIADDAAELKAQSNNKLNPAIDAGPAEAVAIPECLTKLKLSESQQKDALEIMRKYDAELDLAWRQFGDKYMETVRSEVLLLAVVEDNLTEPQRSKVRRPAAQDGTY